VILSRHGVRAPTRDPTPLAPSRPWGAWPVLNYGDLTLRGEDLMRRFGIFYRNAVISSGLLPQPGCNLWRDRVYVYADNDQRTLRSGEGLLTGIGPLCGFAVHSRGSGKDPLFHPGGERKRIMDAPELKTTYRTAVSELRTALGCCALDGPTPLGVASTASEIFQLEYANGMQVAWGRTGPDVRKFLNDVVALHVLYASLNHRSPNAAREEGSNLLANVGATLQQMAGGGDGGFTQAYRPPASSKIVFIVGHDTNLANVGGLLGLHWTLPGFPPDDMPAGSALAFELRRCGLTAVCVRAVYRSQTLDFMRNPAGRAAIVESAVAIPECPKSCSLADFRALVARKVDGKRVRL